MSTLDDFAREFVPYQPHFTLTEVAALTGFGRDWLYDECAAGRIEHGRAGRRRIMTRPQVLKLLADTLVEARGSRAVADEDPRVAAVRERVARRLAQQVAS